LRLTRVTLALAGGPSLAARDDKRQPPTVS